MNGMVSEVCLQNARDLIFKFIGINIKKNLFSLGVIVLAETDKNKTSKVLQN